MYESIDFSSTGIEPFDEGTYTATVSSLVITTSKAGNPMIKAEFTLDDEPYVGRKAFDNLSLKPNSLWATKRALLNMGAEAEALSSKITPDVLREICASLVGNQVTLKITVRTRDDNGELANDVEVARTNSVFGF